MKVYLVRHGESSAIGSDNERPLSEKGKKDIKQLANFIASLHIQAANIFHSEKRRARETAEILSPVITLQGTIATHKELDPHAPVTAIANAISTWENDTLLVGHMPFMGKLVSLLTVGNEDKNIVVFKAGSMVCLQQIEQRQWAICWMLNPELLSL